MKGISSYIWFVQSGVRERVNLQYLGCISGLLSHFLSTVPRVDCFTAQQFFHVNSFTTIELWQIVILRLVGQSREHFKEGRFNILHSPHIHITLEYSAITSALSKI